MSGILYPTINICHKKEQQAQTICKNMLLRENTKNRDKCEKVLHLHPMPENMLDPYQ